MKVTRWQLEWAVSGMRQAIELSGLLGVRVRRDLRDVLQQLDDLLMFADEQGSPSQNGELQLELLGAKAVAAELGCTPQHVGRIAKDLGGQRVEGHWVFPPIRRRRIQSVEGRCLMTSTEVFELAVSCYLRELDDSEFAALTRRVRPPKESRYPAKRNGKRCNSNEVNHGD